MPPLVTPPKLPRHPVMVFPDPKPKMNPFAMLLAAGMAVFVVIVIGGLLLQSTFPAGPQPKVTPTPDPSKDPYVVFEMAKRFVKGSLKAPSTADFGTGVLGDDYQDPSNSVFIQPDGTYTVKIWVDAQNSFGAKIRGHYILHLRYRGDGNWQSLDGITPYDQ